jgi:broad specificity phosphatase PhoE
VRLVLLVRHASTAWTGARYSGRSDPPLNDEGQAQLPGIAAGVTQILGGRVPSIVITSPAHRAVGTAEAIAAALGLPAPRTDPDWLEVDMGDADGLDWDGLQSRFPEVARGILAGDDVDWPGGERMDAFLERVGRAWLRAIAAARTGPVVIVSHGGPIQVAARLSGTGTVGRLDPGDIVTAELDDPPDDGS